VWVFQFGPQNQQLQFGDLGLKITVTNFLVWASKSSGLQFVGCVTKQIEDEGDVGHALRSSALQVGLGFSSLTSRLVEAQRSLGLDSAAVSHLEFLFTGSVLRAIAHLIVASRPHFYSAPGRIPHYLKALFVWASNPASRLWKPKAQTNRLL
jgi:hypothetical protein